MTRERLEELLQGFSSLTIALVGDLFLDRYLEIDSSQPVYSLETGLEAYQVRRVRNSPGAMGTVMNNLQALGVMQMLPVTVVGDDGHAYDLIKELRLMRVDPCFSLHDATRLTPTYTKPMLRHADGQWRELNRLDVRTAEPVSEQLIERLLVNVSAAFHRADGMIVVDQSLDHDSGVVGPEVRARLAELARDVPDKILLIDSRKNLARFQCGILKPNLGELMAAAADLGVQVLSGGDRAIENEIQHAAQALTSRTGRPIFCTRGELGISVISPGGERMDIPGYPVQGPIDIVGAGDSATAGIMATLLAGGDAREAATVGNLVASITVRQIGTTGTASPEQVLARWDEVHANAAGKSNNSR